MNLTPTDLQSAQDRSEKEEATIAATVQLDKLHDTLLQSHEVRVVAARAKTVLINGLVPIAARHA